MKVEGNQEWHWGRFRGRLALVNQAPIGPSSSASNGFERAHFRPKLAPPLPTGTSHVAPNLLSLATWPFNAIGHPPSKQQPYWEYQKRGLQTCWSLNPRSRKATPKDNYCHATRADEPCCTCAAQRNCERTCVNLRPEEAHQTSFVHSSSKTLHVVV